MAASKAIAPVELPLPPGFRFHPTDEELVNSYLKRKILLEEVNDFIPVVDLYKCEPWELPDKSFSTSRHDPSTEGPKMEWYLFGPRDRKYTNGFRMNRATRAGHWKSTGKDRPVMHHHATIGIKKTLVYHLGRAPNSVRTDWVMHEYRLHHHDMPAMQDTYALCRVFKKNAMTPLADVPSGIDTGMDDALMQFMPIDDSWMQFVSDDAWYSTADANKDGSWMQFMPGDTDMNMDGSRMHFVSGGADTDKDGMQFVPDFADTDKDGIRSVPGGTERTRMGCSSSPTTPGTPPLMAPQAWAPLSRQTCQNFSPNKQLISGMRMVVGGVSAC